MGEILKVLISFPAAPFTVVTLLAVLYWLFVIIGAVDMDAIGGAAKGAMEGAAGAAKGAFEGVAGASKGAAEGLHDGGLDDVGEADAGLLSFLRIKHAPVTVVTSLFAIFGVLITGLYGLTFGIPSFLLGLPVFFGSVLVSYLMTALAVRPIAPLFKSRPAAKSNDFVGKIATVSTGRVTDRFGQATLEDGGAGLILEVRSEGENTLKRGDRVVLVHWDANKEVFEVEKMPDSVSTGLRVGGAASSAGPSADPTNDLSSELPGRRDHRA